MTISGGTTWTYDETLTLTASAGTFIDGNGNTRTTFLSTDIDNAIHVEDSTGDVIRFTIKGYNNNSPTVVTGLAHKTVPTTLRSIASAVWGKAVKSVSGLWHLEAEELAVFGDSFVEATPINDDYDTVTVASGIASLSKPYVIIHAGLGYSCDLETLDIDSSQSETLVGKRKNIGKVIVQVENTRGIWAGVSSTDTLNEVKSRNFEGYDEAVDLATGTQEVTIESSWTAHGRVFIRIKDPVPASILSIVSMGEIPYRQ